MTKKEHGEKNERLCDAAGDLAARVIPERAEAVVRWATVRERMQHGRRLRPMAIALAAVAGAAAVLFGVLHGLPRSAAMTYTCGGCSPGTAGTAASAPGAPAEIRFDDGTSVQLAPASTTRIAAHPDGSGAELQLDGEATLAVVHRPGARWLVRAGDYRVEVTGTRFRVLWDERSGRFEVELHAGHVSVLGPRLGRIDLRAGERLIANARDLDGAPLVVRTNELTAAPEPIVEQPPEEPLPAVTGRPSPSRRTPRATPARRAGTAGIDDPFADLSVAAPDELPAPQGPQLGAGEGACAGPAVRFSFDETTDGFTAQSWPAKALGNARVARTRSWCGGGSLVLDAAYRLDGPRNRRNQLLSQAGEVTVRLSAPVDLTGRTLKAHVFIEGPPDAVVGAHLFALSHNRRIPVGERGQLTPGRWWELRHTFAPGERTFDGDEVRADEVWQLGVEVYGAGGQRTWSGRVYVDEVELLAR